MKILIPMAAVIVAAGAALLLTGCKKTSNLDDRQAIEELLGTSDYTRDEVAGITDDGSKDPERAGFGPKTMALSLSETLPWVRFARCIERPLARNVNITIPAYPGYPDTTALAVVTGVSPEFPGPGYEPNENDI